MTDQPAAARPRYRLLVVEDEPSIRTLLEATLRLTGYEVSSTDTGQSALLEVERLEPHLVLLDVMLPDLDGFEVARRVRDEGMAVPILFLTAKADLDDKATGFSLGADDYVTKPFSLAEIVMRVRAVLRRTAGGGGPASELRLADLVMDVDAHQVWRGGAPIQLTATEFRLLHLFLLNPGRVLSKSQILDHVWQYDFDGESNILETYVSYLRRKLNEHGPPLIHTVRLVGYVLREPAAG